MRCVHIILCWACIMPKQNHLFHIHCNLAQACSYLQWYIANQTGWGGKNQQHTNEDESFMLQLTRTQIVHRIKTTCLILCWSASCCLEELLWVMSTRALGVFCGRLFCTQFPTWSCNYIILTIFSPVYPAIYGCRWKNTIFQPSPK